MRWRFWERGVIRRSEVEITPEEIFMDAANAPGFRQEMHEGRLERPISRRTFTVFGAAVAIGFLIIAGRMFDLEILRGDDFAMRANENKTYPIAIEAPRGIFYDRHFEKLVENAPSFTVSLRPGDLSDDGTFRDIFMRLAALLGKSVEEIADANGVPLAALAGDARFSRASWPDEIFMAAGDMRGEVLELQTHQEDFPGVRITETSRRHYLFARDASHVLGYVGRPTKAELAAHPDLGAGDIVGKTGLEAAYEGFLRGTRGEKLIEVDASGEARRERFIVKPDSGKDVVLEIDAGLQEFAAETLARHIRAAGKRAGALVAVDPRDGAVRALVSYPSFDPNVFGRSAKREDVEALLANPARPFYNRAVGGGYPSGSTIKPILAVAALEEKIIDPERAIFDPGYISVPNPFDPAKPTIFKDWKELGWVDMRRALAMSANVYFYTVGGGYGDIKGLGIERMKRYLERFGWGSTLGIDLPGEVPGLIPDPEKKKTLRPKDPIWRIGDTYITAIGQGDLQATPLQLAVSTAAIANGGTLWKPRVAAAVIDEEQRPLREFRPEVIRDRLADPDSLRVVREGMRQAVTDGSAGALRDLFFAVAGKTGTAQTGAIGKNHGWFTGFAPYDEPELAITVLVEEGSGGSTDAVPVAKEVLYYYFTHRDNPQLTPLENSHIIESTSTQN